MTDRYDCSDPDQRKDGVYAAASAVRRGDIVVLPTDTVYGVGCDAFDAGAVASVLAAKGRGRDMPPPVLIPTARTAQGLATQVPDYAQALMERFWPGPLTLVLKAQTSLHWDLGETNGTVALRVPASEVALELLGEIGPMAVTSANTTGDPAARTVDDAMEMLGESVAVYLDAGPASDGEASTIIDCTGEAPITLRLGAIAQEVIDAAILEAEAAAEAERTAEAERVAEAERAAEGPAAPDAVEGDAPDETPDDAPAVVAADDADTPDVLETGDSLGEWRDVTTTDARSGAGDPTEPGPDEVTPADRPTGVA